MKFQNLKFNLLFLSLILLSGCFSDEPSEAEMEVALRNSALSLVKNDIISSGGIFAGAFTKDMSIDIRNFEKISCDELSEKRYSCEIFAEVKVNFTKEVGNLLAIFGGGQALDWMPISGKEEFIKLKSGWVIKSPN